MLLLAFRLAAAPVLVLAGTLAQQRFGQSVGGRLVGLPLTSLPLLGLLAAAEGLGFAAAAATAALAGVVAQCVWALVYSVAARRHGAPWAATAATASFGATCVLLLWADPGLVAATALAAASVVGALALWPAASTAPEARPATRREIGARMAAGSAFTVAVTGAGGSVGPQAAGLLGSYPVLTVVLAVATHRRVGAGAVADFLGGVVAGTLSVVAALATLAALLRAIGPVGAFPAALGASIAAQLVPLGWARRRGAPQVSSGAAGSISTSSASAPAVPQVRGLTSSPAMASPSSLAIEATATTASITASMSATGPPR